MISIKRVLQLSKKPGKVLLSEKSWNYQLIEKWGRISGCPLSFSGEIKRQMECHRDYPGYFAPETSRRKTGKNWLALTP